MSLPNTYRAGPDARGRFGIYGGRFVAETLMPLILELERAYEEAKERSGVSGGARRLARRLRRPPDAALPGRAPERAARRRAHLLQARRAHPHRRPQDQQHHRPDPARPAHGQAPDHRRDRRRAARRRDRDGGRAPRPGVRGLHGRARHRAAEAERLPHAAAGRRGARRDVRLRDAQGRHERGAPRLGRQRREHLLHHRQRRRPAPLSRHGARLPVGDRQRGARPDPRQGGPPAGHARRLRRRRLERDRPVPSVPRRARGADDRGRGGRPRHRERRARGGARRPAARACSTARARTCSRTTTAR